MVSKKSKRSKTKPKKRPPRIFIKGKKLYIQIGKKKVLLKDADKYKKSDIVEILLKQLLVRRKRRNKGEITKRERRLNREDLRIFNEFENMNRNQSKGTLKVPAPPEKLQQAEKNNKEATFYNAMLSFLKTTPQKDINIEVQKQLAIERKKAQQEQETARNLLREQQQALQAQQQAIQGREQAQQRAQQQRAQQQQLQQQALLERQQRERQRLEREEQEAEQRAVERRQAEQERTNFLERAIARREALDEEERNRQRELNRQERELQREINRQELENRLVEQNRARQEMMERFQSSLVEYKRPEPQPQPRGPAVANIEPLLRDLEMKNVDIEAKQNIISRQQKLLIYQNDIAEIRRSNKIREIKPKLKQWVDAIEQETGPLNYGTYRGNPKSYAKASITDIFEAINNAYGGTLGSNADQLVNDYFRFRSSIIEPIQPQEQKEQKEQKEEKKEVDLGQLVDPSKPTVSDLPPPLEEEPPRIEAPPEMSVEDFLRETEEEKQQQDISGSELDDVSSTNLSEFSSSESDEEDIGAVASSVLGQIADGHSYTGTGLMTQEIDNMIKPILKKEYIGTLPADFNKFLPKKLPKKFGFVMNTDPSNKQGKHWISCIVDLKNDMSVEYFDSFGKSPSKKFMKEIKKLIDKLKPNTYLKMKINNVKHQDDRSQNCGWFAMKFLIDRLKLGVPFKTATKYEEQPDKTKEGENNINELKNKFGYI